MQITNIRILGSDFVIRRGNIEIGDDGRFGKITYSDKDEGETNIHRMTAIPGLIDIHLHGCLGDDFCDGDQNAIRKMARYQAFNGITAIMPATLTLSQKDLKTALVSIAEVQEDQRPGEADLVGINMEGPFISSDKKGSQNERFILPCDTDLVSQFLEYSRGLVKVLGFAPEVNPDFETFIEENKNRVKISLAHTNATYEMALDAFKMGASHVTHLYNAMSGLYHRDPGVVGAAYDSRQVTAELITDGVHVHPTMVRQAFHMLGPERIIMISDSVRATGMRDGMYSLGGQKIIKEGRYCTMASDGRLAGSSSNLMDCLRIAVLEMGLPLSDAVRTASLNPAKFLGIDADYGSIETGKKANLVLLDEKMRVTSVIKDGKMLKSFD